MPVNRACYATRQDVMSATDIKQVQDNIRHVDSAIEAGSHAVDQLTRRKFWNEVRTVYYEWPNFQRAYPWRIWFDATELADVTTLVPVVTTGTTTIPNSAIFWQGSSNYAPPYTYMELDRSQSYSFGFGPTPQRSVKIVANTGYWNQTRSAGTLTSAMSDTTGTTAAISDSSLVGVGDVIIVGTESMLVRDMTWSTTGLTLSSGGTTAQANDTTLTLSGSGVSAGEVIQVDSEWMLVTSVSPANAAIVTVVRSYNGSVLATHSAATTVYAQRSCTVTRGFGGSTAATHLNGAAVNAQLIPTMVRELAIAEALNLVYQKTSGWARTIGEQARTPPGGSLPDLRAAVAAAYGRRARQRGI